MSVSWSQVVVFAATLPETAESTSYNTPALKVRGKLFARLRTEADGGLALKCSAEDKQSLVASADPAYNTLPHYDRSNYVLVDLARVDRAELQELVVDAWRIAAPGRLREAFDA